MLFISCKDKGGDCVDIIKCDCRWCRVRQGRNIIAGHGNDLGIACEQHRLVGGGAVDFNLGDSRLFETFDDDDICRLQCSKKVGQSALGPRSVFGKQNRARS